jgi:TetR/AcrR family transcriptional regulator, mexJK operon transcriptional repressor
VFMNDGFEGASVDKIAKSAAVSKATLYSYFPDKKSMFIAVVRAQCSDQTNAAVADIDTNAPVRAVLRGAATHMVSFFLSDFGQRVFRICVAESDRFPDLAREFYESGPRVARDALAQFFALATARDELDIDDRELAACQFVELCKADVFAKIVFGVQDKFTQVELDRVISGAVDMFMARYGVKP